MAGEERLKTLRKQIEDAQRTLHDLDKVTRAQNKDAFAGLEATLGYVSLVLERTDPLLIAPSAHAELARLLEQIVGNPATAAASPDSFTDGLLGQAALLPAAGGRDMEQAGKDAARTLRRSASQHLRGLRAEAEALREQLADVKAEIATAQQSATADNEAETTKLQQALTTIQSAAEAAQAKVEELADGFENDFETAEAARDKQVKDGWKQTRQEIRDDANELVADLQRMREDAQGLVGAVSVATTANHFRADAKREQIAYIVLLTVTVLVLAGAVVVAHKAASHPNIDVQLLIAKLGVASGLVTLGYFTGRRATDHRDREKVARDKEADMRVFGPFIEPLPPKEQIQERILMARRFFGRTAAPVAAPEDEAASVLLSTDEEIDIHASDLRKERRDRGRMQV